MDGEDYYASGTCIDNQIGIVDRRCSPSPALTGG